MPNQPLVICKQSLQC